MAALLLTTGLVVVLTQCGVPTDSDSPAVVDLYVQPVAAAVAWDEGATIDVAYGSGSQQMRLIIPPDVLIEDATVSVTQAQILPDGVDEGDDLVGPIFNIEGLEGKINGIVTLVLPYQFNRIPSNLDANDVFVAFWDGVEWAVVGRTDLDPIAQTVTIETYHASMWAAIASPPYEIDPEAGKDQVVTSGQVVRLDASDSTPIRVNRYVTVPAELDFRWRQMIGTPVTLDDATSSTPSFTAPTVTNDMNLKFEVTVASGYSGNNYETDAVVVTVTPRPAPDQASDPSPAQGATDVALDVALSWTAAEDEATHRLYVGTDSEAVQQAATTSPLYLGELSTARYAPAAPFGTKTTYYWRVDEVTPGGVTQGVLWRFTTLPPLPGAVSTPSPADGAVQQPVGTSLAWTAGSDVVSHDIYLGTSETLVAQATTVDVPIYQGRQASRIFDPSSELYHGTTYYWRVDEVNAAGVTKGTVYRFTTIEAPANQASNPTPANQATGVPTSASLSWEPGLSTATHNVYFGTDPVAVTYATTTDAVFQGNQAAATHEVAGGLLAGRTYYWRIDEVTEAGVTKGPVWSFSTMPAIPGAASDPDPADAATDVATSSWLTWTPGSDAVYHEVYLGTNSDSVAGAESGDTPIYRGKQSGKYYNPAAAGESLALLPNTTYYWRVDEGNEAGVTTGTVWQFTTAVGAPQPANQPSPGSDLTGVAVDVVLSWTAGTHATAHRVYFGEDRTSVSQATTDSVLFKGEQSGTTYDPTGDLNAATQYFWRIDEVNPAGTTKGPVWNFTTN